MLLIFVGVAGVEPAASWSQTKRLSPRLYPVTVGGRRGARTLASISQPNGLANRPLHQLEYPSIRSLLGIRTQTLSSVAIGANPLHQETIFGGDEGNRTPNTFHRTTCFQDKLLVHSDHLQFRS